jgi:4-amino-4-deoxy-L-arabinose transferase-like glycosyltransferase
VTVLFSRSFSIKDVPPIAIVAIAATARISASVAQVLGSQFWPTWLPGPSIWGDFGIYISDLGLIMQGYLPYRDFSFNYGPLFLYSMIPFYEISPYLASIPSLIADTITSLLIYLSAKPIAGSRLAIALGLGYALSPYVVINEGYLWLSSQPMTMFVIGALYLMRRNQPLAGLLSLALAALFKQEALFILPPFLLAYWRRYGRRVVNGIIAGSLTLLAGISPFLALAPRATLYSLMYGPFINLGPIEPSRLPEYLGRFGSATASTDASCHILTIPGAYTGTLCGSLLNTSQFLNSLGYASLERFGLVVEPILLLLFAISLFAIRRSPVLLEISSAYSLLVFLFFFSTFVHELFAYYLLPVYAILAAYSTSRLAATATVTAIVIATFTPEGPFAFLLPLLTVFSLIIIESNRLSRNLPSVGISQPSETSPMTCSVRVCLEKEWSNRPTISSAKARVHQSNGLVSAIRISELYPSAK